VSTKEIRGEYMDEINEAELEEDNMEVKTVSVVLSVRLKRAVDLRVRELSRDVSKHIRRLVVDDLVTAGHITREEGLLLL